MKVRDYYKWLKDNWAQTGLILSLYLSVFSFIFIRENNFPAFLIIIQTPLYMIHESEEYLFPGGFKHFFNYHIFKIEDEKGALDKNFIFFVNVVLIWVILPLFGLLSIKNLSFGLWIPYFSLFAGFAHILLGIKSRKLYNPGLIVSLFLNIPVGIFVIFYFFNNGILNNLFLNFHFLIGFLLNLSLPIAGKIIYERYKKKN